MSPKLSDRSIQTIVSNAALTAMAIAILTLRPDIFALGTIIGAFLTVNGFEALKQSQERSENK
jgi:hypothetical protein